MITRMGAGTITLIVALCATSACMGPLAIFDTLVINRAGSGYTLVASASGMASVTSAPFTTVSGATGSAARAP